MSKKLSKKVIGYVIKDIEDGVPLEKVAYCYDQSEKTILILLKKHNVDVSKIKRIPWIERHAKIGLVIFSIVCITTFLYAYKPGGPL